MKSALKKYFGYSVFREQQKEVIENIIEGRDSLVVMATGSGKSLCYQLPPLIVEKTAIVVSPLISLMQDQVMALKQRGIKAEYIASAQTDFTVHSKAEAGFYSILFMTPERACSLPIGFWSTSLRAGICLFAVDEAHCISEWGHDFRVEYKKLDQLRDLLIDVPFVALTATATKMVRNDIINSLKLKDPYIAIGSFDRKNLFYGVKPFTHGLPSLDELIEEISKFVSGAGSTIIYCTTIKDVEQICTALKEAGIKAGMYHGQMADQARHTSHRLFIKDELHVMVATIAFGMGIDKPNIRCVIHYGCPKNLESYYQQSGRCGRDGISSVCWLYPSGADFAKADFYCRESHSEVHRKAIMESLMVARRYCLLTTCRRIFLLNYFGEKSTSDKCGNCDNCTTTRKERDMSREAYLLLSCIQSCRGSWGMNMPIDVLRGSRSRKIVDAMFDKHHLHGLGKDHASNWWKELGSQLISYGYLVESVKDVYRTVSVSSKGLEFLGAATHDYQPSLLLPEMNSNANEGECKGAPDGFLDSTSSTDLECEGLSEAEAKLYSMLLEERLKLARRIGTAPYAICGDQTIWKIALTRPSTKARLANIDGVNQHLIATHGDHILQTIEHLAQELNLSLDGSSAIQIDVPKKSSPLQSGNIKITPAKLQAWRMWQEGTSIQKIASFPGRSAPIKEQTVISYLLEAAHEGYTIDWTRFCSKIGLKHEMLSGIQDAISKVGSKDRLKPIKEELPQDVSYEHIKTYLTMQELGALPETTRPSCPGGQKDEAPSLICASQTEGSAAQMALSYGDGDEHSCSRKRSHEATEDTVLDLIKNYHDGILLSDILEHFKGYEEFVVDLLCSLEADFIIFKKDNMYMVM